MSSNNNDDEHDPYASYNFDYEMIENSIKKDKVFLKYLRIVVVSVLVLLAFLSPYLAEGLLVLSVILMPSLICGAEYGIRKEALEGLKLYREREKNKKAKRFNDRFRT